MNPFIFTIIFAPLMRLFLFEIKFGGVRQKLMAKNKLFDIFLNCSFCNGFWTGLVTYAILNIPLYSSFLLGDYLWFTGYAFYVAVAVGSLSYLVDKLFYVLEKEDVYSP